MFLNKINSQNHKVIFKISLDSIRCRQSERLMGNILATLILLQ